jgi:hypothetical protein
MRIVPPFMLILATCSNLPVSGADAFGVWRADPGRSTNAYNHVVVVRFEAHSKGEVFTLDQIDRDGRSTTSSTILYLDGKSREFEGFRCSGTQSSRRLDSRTIEILRACNSGERVRLVRRLSTDAKELVLEITEQQTAGRFKRRLILQKE